MALEQECEDGRIAVRCSVCRWLTWFSVEVIHEVHDETTWVCEVCNGRRDWDGFSEPDPFPSHMSDPDADTVRPPKK